MTNTYRPVSEYGKAQWGPDVFDGDFTVTDEKDHIDGGHLEIVPRKYTVLSDNFSGGPQGGEYMGALRKEIEAALIQGGHIQRVDDEPPADEQLDELPGEDGGDTSFKDTTVEGGKAKKSS